MMKLQYNIIRIAQYFLILFAIFVVTVSFFEPQIYHDTDLKFILIGLVLYGLLLYGIYRLCMRLPEKSLTYFTYLLIIITFLTQLFIVFKMQVTPKVDLKHIYKQTMDMFEADTAKFTNEKYFSFYTNNIPLAIVIYWIFYLAKLIGITNYRLAGGIFNVLLLFIVYVSTYKILKRITNIRITCFVMFLVLTNPVFYAYAPYYYTDTISLGFMMPGVYFMLCGYQEGNKYKKYSVYFLSSILMSIATKIRITSIFIVLAFVVFLILKRQWKTIKQFTLSFLCGILLFSVLWSGIYNYHIDFDTKDSAVPAQHFLMMASKGKGTYNDDDVAFTRSFETHEEKVTNTTRVWKERIKENGILGNIRLIVTKEAIVWGIGTRGYFQYTQYVVNENDCYHLISGEKSIYFRSFMQAYNIILFLLIGLGIFINRKQDYNYMLVLSIYWLGAIVFYMFWEAHMRHPVSLLILLTIMIIPLIEKFNKISL